MADDIQRHKHYTCNYCNFEGEHNHSCKTYLETLKIFEEMKAQEKSDDRTNT